MYRISEEKFVSLDSTEGNIRVEDVLIVSASDSIPDYDDIPGRVLVPGSIALVPSESKVFLLDFDNEWKEWGVGEDAGTRSVSLAPGSLTKLAGTEEPEEELTEEVKQDEPGKKYTDLQ